jgi:hypothetical protein
MRIRLTSQEYERIPQQAGPLRTDITQLVPERKPKRGGISKVQQARFRGQAAERVKSNDWAGAQPAVLVALYTMFHHRAYGVMPDELQGAQEYQRATYAAAKFVKDQFAACSMTAAACMLWSWQREAEWEQWRRQNKREGGRFTWQRQFSARTATDYRVAMGRQGK